MPKMRKGRMRKWAKWLENFHETKRRHFNLEVVREQDDCGTAACAVGWCPTIFPKHWMIVPKRLRGDEEELEVTLRSSMKRDCDGFWAYDSWEAAAMNFFGLDRDQIARIAIASNYEKFGVLTAQDAAKRIHEIIVEGDAK